MNDVWSHVETSRRAARIFVSLFCAGIVSVGSASAQSLPSPWLSRDVGSPALAGSASQNAGTFTVRAAGNDIWGNADQFHFVYQQVTGDAEVIARVDAIARTHTWAKAGVMIRSSLSAGSAHGLAMVSSGNGVGYQSRRTDGGSSAHANGPAVAAPRWVRVVRLGTIVTAFTSADARTWTKIGSDAIALGSTTYVGLAATSHNVGVLTTATLSEVIVRPLAVPAPQRAVDIGSPSIPGTASARSGTYTINAAGLDVWNTADQFHFVYQPITGDVDVSVRVRSLTQAHAWTKTGVMIRESLTPGSRHAFALVSAGGGYGFHRRIDPDGFTDAGAGVTGAAPGWVRLVRVGSRFEAFRSADGVSWTSLGSDVVPMAEPVYVGIAMTSHNTTATAQAVLDTFTVTTATQPAPNGQPTVALTSPASGATYTAPASVTLAASAADADGTVARVEFYSGSTLLGTDTTSPYNFTWSSVPAGTYSLTAVAYDNVGARIVSAARSITVNALTTTAPTAVVFQASVDHASVTSYRLDVFANGANPATATPVGTSDLAKGTPDANRDITVNRATFFSGLTPGTYQATVTAIGSGGSSRSAPVTFTR